MSGTLVIDRATSIEALYRADAERLWRALFAYCADADLASDALAEAYAQAIRRSDAIRDPAAWIWRAAFRVAAGHLKSRREAERHLRTRSADSPRTHDLTIHDRYADPDLAAALRKLPEAQRAAVVLYYYADLPVREIAARLGSNHLAIRTNLSRGRRRLRQLLGDDGG